MVINKILHYLLLFLGILFIVFPYRFKYFYILFFISFFLSLISSFGFKKMGLGEKEYFLILIVIWLNALGELWFYFSWIYYDKFLHFVVPFIISIIYASYLHKNNQKINAFFFFTILGILAFFEIFEWLVDGYIGFPMLGVLDASGESIMSPLLDTMVDLILGGLGIISYMLFSKSTRTSKKS